MGSHMLRLKLVIRFWSERKVILQASFQSTNLKARIWSSPRTTTGRIPSETYKVIDRNYNQLNPLHSRHKTEPSRSNHRLSSKETTIQSASSPRQSAQSPSKSRAMQSGSSPHSPMSRQHPVEQNVDVPVQATSSDNLIRRYPDRRREQPARWRPTIF